MRLPPDVRDAWKAVLEGRGISQQKAVLSLVRWLTAQEPELQLMLFGQVPVKSYPDLSRIVLKRLAAAGNSTARAKK